eukprot:6200652-Pleurochrysis_carterae.AAC.2
MTCDIPVRRLAYYLDKLNSSRHPEVLSVVAPRHTRVSRAHYFCAPVPSVGWSPEPGALRVRLARLVPGETA